MSAEAVRQEFLVSIPADISGDVMGSKEYAKGKAIGLLSARGLYPVGEFNFYQITGEAGQQRAMYFNVQAQTKTQISLL